jgi:hypothetical protein
MMMNSVSIKETLTTLKDYLKNFFEKEKSPEYEVDIVLKPKPDSAIHFVLKGETVIKLSEEGFFYKGRLVKKDKDVYLACRDFFIKTIGGDEKY